MGILDGWQNVSQQGFLNEAQPKDVQNVPNTVQPPQAPQAPQEQVATTIVWNDAAPQGLPEPAPAEQPPSIDGQIDNSTPESVESGATDAGVDAKTAKSLSKVIGDSTGIADLTNNLENLINKEESKRDSLKLLMASLALLGGEGFAGAAQAANAIGGFNSQRINALYDQRKSIQDRVTKAALNKALPSSGGSNEFSTGWEGDDGNIYFDPNKVPAGVSIVGKAGTKDPNVPGKWITVQTESINAVKEADEQLAQITNVIDTIPDDAWSGVFGRGKKSLKQLLGSQDAADNWRTQVINLRTSAAIQNLPKGPASDRDIELVLSGQVDGFANPEAITQFNKATQRLAKYKKRYNQALIDFIEVNKTASGFEPPAYDPSGSDQATAGVVTSSSNNQEVDLDLSDI